jgi:hypothetical protein
LDRRAIVRIEEVEQEVHIDFAAEDDS